MIGGTGTTLFKHIGENKWLKLFVLSAKIDVELKRMDTMQTTQQPKGSTGRRKPKADDAKLRQELISILDKFFEGTSYTVMFEQRKGGGLRAMVVYTDFFSEHLVGKMIADAVPKELHVVLKREYSDKAVAKVLLDEYRRNRVAVVDCYNGELRPQIIKDFVNKSLEKCEIL